MIKLLDILQEITITPQIRNNKQLLDFANKNKQEIINYVLKALGKEHDPEWNYVRDGWQKNKFQYLSDLIDIENSEEEIVLDDGEDDRINLSINPFNLPDNDPWQNQTKEMNIKGVKIYWYYY